MRDDFVKTLTRMASKDPRIMLITGDLGFNVLNDFASRFPNQYINAGVAEQNMTGVATGLALEGYIVYTYSIANFVFMRCLEQIRNDAAYHDANVNVVCVGGGFSYGALGISHHATEDLSIMRSLPGVSVFCPSDTWETEQITAASAETAGVSYLRLDKSVASVETQPGEEFRFGAARMIHDGDALTFISAGGIMNEVLIARRRLADMDIHCRVLSLPTIKPLDGEAIQRAVLQTGGVITVEEHSRIGGIGSAVGETILDAGLYPHCFARMGLDDRFSSHVGSQAFLRTKYGLDADAIFHRACRELKVYRCVAA